LKVESAAKPRLLIAWYIVAPPAVEPIIESSCRRVIALPAGSSVM